jgi:hypothetical protein
MVPAASSPGSIRRLLAWAVALAITGVATRSLVRAVTFARASYGVSTQDDITLFDRSLDPARKLLAGEPTVGYVSLVPNGLIGALEQRDQTRRFFFAQYGLAPSVLLLRTTGTRWVFADLHPKRLRRYAEENGYEVRWNNEDFGVLEARR